ncbi:MAG: T9SS type A sorting domain-containing protein [Bacteroidales bacterium]|nr:T9SS type A sorting domain-containing protein [Bacteroidales bacterium]
MKKLLLIVFTFFATIPLFAQVVEKTFYFSDFQISQKGTYRMIVFPGTQLSGLPGEPVLPYQTISLILPPEQIAASIEVIGEMEREIPGTYTLFPQQHVRPLSEETSGNFIRNEAIYKQQENYPASHAGHLITQFMNGYGIALSSFTPVTYNPAKGTLAYYGKVIVRIHTSADPAALNALDNLNTSATTRERLVSLVQNPEMAENYPTKASLKTDYQILIITTSTFSDSFQSLIDMYQAQGMTAQVVTTQAISSAMTGQDLQEKIRNYIIQEYQTNSVEFILLGGDVELVPYRGFYCQVESSSLYEDDNIPADLYYSALDGTWDDNGNLRWGEPGEDDLLPDIAVTRFPFSTETELQHMIHKSVFYQTSPVDEERQNPFLAGEHLYSDPMTFGSDYLDLLIDEQTANGYYTHGIPSSENTITTLYDTLISLPNNIYQWDVSLFLNEINEGKSFIHHCGHANVTYVARLNIWDINNQNFSQVNGVDHNYTLMYTHGCLCGAFDESDCIGERMVTIDNFLVGGAFNSRYGWFNEGQTEGPSAHLHREFVSALYNDTIAYKRIGETHMMSKIKTAPWVTAPGQWEPGALRWCFYDCNVFGDPAMEIWTGDPTTGTTEVQRDNSLRLYPNPAGTVTTLSLPEPLTSDADLILTNMLGQTMMHSTLSAQEGTANMFRLDLTGLGPGLYHVTIETTTGIKSTKLIIR